MYIGLGLFLLGVFIYSGCQLVAKALTKIANSIEKCTKV